MSFIASIEYGNRPDGWKTFFLGLIAPFENQYKSKFNQIVNSSNHGIEFENRRREMEEKLKKRQDL